MGRDSWHSRVRGLHPPDKRAGFRGFVEFDRGAERELRRAESSQHDSFARRGLGVRNLLNTSRLRLKNSQKKHGWSTHQSVRPAPTVEREVALDFLRFLAPRTRRPPGPGPLPLPEPTEHWECDLCMDFPDPQSTRVDWGQYIRNLDVSVRFQPIQLSRHATVSLELAQIDDSATSFVAGELPIELRNGEGLARFGDFQIITGAPSAGKLQCSQPGKWLISARVESDGELVARARATMFVNEDPPPRVSNPYALSISVENHSTQQRRINNGDSIGVLIGITNRTPHGQTLALTASLGDLLLADKKPVATHGTLPVRLLFVRQGYKPTSLSTLLRRS